MRNSVGLSPAKKRTISTQRIATEITDADEKVMQSWISLENKARNILNSNPLYYVSQYALCPYQGLDHWTDESKFVYTRNIK